MTFPTRTGIALVICAPSGTGKTTLVRRLLAAHPRFAYSVSCTTRAPRLGEMEGKDYFFLGQEDFIQRKDRGFFAEWAAVHGNFYGTPLQNTRDMLAAGKDVLFDIDVQGAAQLRKTMPEAQLVFILPPSREALVKRLNSRGTESPESLQRRLNNAKSELEQANEFDYWVVNDDLDQALQDLTTVYHAAALAPSCQAGGVATLLQGWS